MNKKLLLNKFGRIFLMIGVFASFATTANAQTAEIPIECKANYNQDCINSCNNLKIDVSESGYDDGPTCNKGRGGINWGYNSTWAMQWMHKCSYGWGGRDWYWKVRYFNATCVWQNNKGEKFTYLIPPLRQGTDNSDYGAQVNYALNNSPNICNSNATAQIIKQKCISTCLDGYRWNFNDLIAKIKTDLERPNLDPKSATGMIMNELKSGFLKNSCQYDPNLLKN